jgi:tetratricopeptide (TPR) repeat protein
MAEFRRALELEPNNSEAVVNLASHLFTQRQTEEALALLERRVAHGPDDPDAWLYLGMTLVDTVTDDSPAALTALRRAIAAFERVTELRPTDAKAWYHLGDAHCMASEPEAALVALERGLEVRPDGPDLRLGRARALAQLGRYVEAVERTLEVVRALPTASLPKEQALELYQQTQDPDDRAKIEALLSAAGLL